MDTSQWERSVLEKIALEGLAEQRRARRWKIFFRFLFLGMFALFIVLAAQGEDSSSMNATSEAHTSVVELNGPIGPGLPAAAERVITGLRHAFEDKNTKGIVLKVNSPGGSPVHSQMVFDEIRRLRSKYPKIPLYAVVQDICASGCYYIVAAADQIYVSPASLVGSIGVRMDGFGFTGTLDKLGVERRLVTAGEHKGFLDPFSPQKPEEVAHVKQMLSEIHQQFIDAVRLGRGKRLKETPELFSGLMWNGQRSLQLGLVDAIGTTDSVARTVIKAEKFVNHTQEEELTARVAKRFGVEAGQAVSAFFGAMVR